MFYEKLAEKKRERKSQQTSRLDDIGFNVGAGMLAHKGLEKALDASAFSPYNQAVRDMGAVARIDAAEMADERELPRKKLKEAYKLIKKNMTENKNDAAEASFTTTHNPLTRVVDNISGAEDMARKRRQKIKESKELYKMYEEGGEVSPDLLRGSSAAEEAAEELTGKMRKRRLLGRRVAHGVGLGAALLGANKLRNMYNNRNQEKKTAAFVKMLSEE